MRLFLIFLALCGGGWYWFMHVYTNTNTPPAQESGGRWAPDGRLRLTRAEVYGIVEQLKEKDRAKDYTDIVLSDGTKVPIKWTREEFGLCPITGKPNCSVAVPMTLAQ